MATSKKVEAKVDVDVPKVEESEADLEVQIGDPRPIVYERDDDRDDWDRDRDRRIRRARSRDDHWEERWDEDEDEYAEDREYSSGNRDVNYFFDGVVNSADRLARGFSEGVRTYRRRHHQSARDKKDGAARDFFENVSEGLSDGLDIAKEAPRDFTRKVSTRRLTRLATPIPFNVFLRD